MPDSRLTEKHSRGDHRQESRFLVARRFVGRHRDEQRAFDVRGAGQRTRRVAGRGRLSKFLARALRRTVGGGLAAPGFPLPPNTHRALLRGLAQAVAGDPLAVRIVVRNPGHSRRARVFLNSALRAPRDRGNRCDAHHEAGEHQGNRADVHDPSSCGCIHYPAARVARRMVDIPTSSAGSG